MVWLRCDAGPSSGTVAADRTVIATEERSRSQLTLTNELYYKPFPGPPLSNTHPISPVHKLSLLTGVHSDSV